MMTEPPGSHPWPPSDHDFARLPRHSGRLQFGPLSPPPLAPRTAVLWTADDAERRLLATVPPPLAFLALCGDWTLGGAVVTDGPWQQPSDFVQTLERLEFHSVSASVGPPPVRPSLTPRYKSLPEWIGAAFQAWRSAVRPVSTVEMTAVEAGLRQLHDDLDGSHQCAQSIEGAGRHHGDYWHAIMHRREPDYGNSQYWFRRVGRHPVFTPLAREAEAVAVQFPSVPWSAWLPKLVSGGVWNPMAGVDCMAEAAGSTDAAFRRAAEELQYRELLLLFAETCRDAV